MATDESELSLDAKLAAPPTDVLDRVLDLRADPPAEPVALPPSRRALLRRPEGYIPEAGLLDAIRVAFELRQPLLVTGEPGTGKTRLADFVAYRLGLDEPLVFRVKSTSVAQELLYRYDAVGRFNARSEGKDTDDLLPYIQFGALGRAILLANPADQVRDYLPDPESRAREPRISVVLIDEIDKAPRDFPNDFLGELDEMTFSVAEMDRAPDVTAPDALMPVVIITSNSEKDLPEAFLRRCIYYHIRFPPRGTLVEIVATRLRDVIPPDTPFLSGAVDMFLHLRTHRETLQKTPGTSELIEWLLALERMGVDISAPFEPGLPAVGQTLGVLFKTQQDLRLGASIIKGLANE